ncbi:hypothetical protein, conserved [Entamoeba dispar SAW760]|uniref:Uncharacterized protein n=1 Tax=Entamoeba dispar (strain ATCC PRA-260 / SAW760) TaxID=370354 RepID=B0E8N5_ENTDS|nr:uncharacterized protein EDI_287650 [Entamoeba dispar SAW760]EDR29125.1 hypothetical protein, conserved [Entamoeba dispar SAW760]|eukprot:EDR29125.1 hypothetical protein, conserved [Entamoeba dispar SAW760]
MKVVTILFVVICICNGQVPADLIDKIHKIKEQRIQEVQQLDKRAKEIESKMDKLLKDAEQIKAERITTNIKNTMTEADKMLSNYTNEEIKKINKHYNQYEKDINATIKSNKNIYKRNEKEWIAQKKLLKFLKNEVKKASLSLEKKRILLKKNREKEKKELQKTLRAVRIARLKGLKEKALAEEHRHELLRKAALEEKKRTKEEIEERKNLIAQWKLQMKELERSEKNHMKTLQEIEEIKKRRGMEQRVKNIQLRTKAQKERFERTERQKALIRKKLEKERIEKFRRELFARRCASLTRAYNKRPKKYVHVCIPKSNIELMGKMKKCLPIWKQDLPSLKRKLNAVDQVRKKLSKKSNFLDPQIDLIVPVY